MKQQFYKEIQTIKWCKKCGEEMRPRRGSVAAQIGLCRRCRRLYWNPMAYRKYIVPYLRRLSPEARSRLQKIKYQNWLRWIRGNKEVRRLQALKSYHRNKEKHRARPHRRTRPAPDPVVE